MMSSSKTKLLKYQKKLHSKEIRKLCVKTDDIAWKLAWSR